MKRRGGEIWDRLVSDMPDGIIAARTVGGLQFDINREEMTL